MNDLHEHNEQTTWFWCSRFKRENPHLLIGGPYRGGDDGPATRYSWAFNYAMPEVRDLFCRIIEGFF